MGKPHLSCMCSWTVSEREPIWADSSRQDPAPSLGKKLEVAAIFDVRDVEIAAASTMIPIHGICLQRFAG